MLDRTAIGQKTYDVALALRTSYEKSRVRNPQYSIRSFSRNLGVSHSAVSEIIRGRRKVSRKMAEALLDKLCLSPIERERFLQKHSSQALNEYRELEHQSFEVLQDPIHFALLALIDTAGFKSDPIWMARRLKSTQARVIAALTNLQAVGLIQKHGRRWIALQTNVRTSENVRNLAIQRNHLNSLEEAKSALTEIDPQYRDFSSLTFAFAPEKVPEAREILREALTRIELLVKQSRKSEVYKISVQVFPKTEMRE